MDSMPRTCESDVPKLCPVNMKTSEFNTLDKKGDNNNQDNNTSPMVKNLERMLENGNKVFHIQVKVPEQPDVEQIQQVIVVNAREDVNKAMNQAVAEIANRVNKECASLMAQGKPTGKEITIEITKIRSNNGQSENRTESPIISPTSNCNYFDWGSDQSKQYTITCPPPAVNTMRFPTMPLYMRMNACQPLQAVRPRVITPQTSFRLVRPQSVASTSGLSRRSYKLTGNSSIDRLKKSVYGSARTETVSPPWLKSRPRLPPAPLQLMTFQRPQQQSVHISNANMKANSTPNTNTTEFNAALMQSTPRGKMDCFKNPVTMIIHPSGSRGEDGKVIMRQFPNPCTPKPDPQPQIAMPLHMNNVLNRSRSLCLPAPRMSVAEVSACPRAPSRSNSEQPAPKKPDELQDSPAGKAAKDST